MLLLGAALALASPLMLTQASAAGMSPGQMKWAQSAASNGAIVEKAGYRCYRWRHKCAWRWGVGTRRFYRCLWRHGC
jgi:hypothetical protein